MSFYVYRQPTYVRGVSTLHRALYPARIEQGFFDHFPGTSLDSRWASVTASSGTVAVANSVVSCTGASIGDASYFYHTTPIKKTDTGLWTFCGNAVTSGGSARRLLTVRDTTTPQTALTWDSDAAMKLRFDLSLDTGTYYGLCHYIDTGSTRQSWNSSAQTWGTQSAAQVTENRVGIDNYIEFGLELDGANLRFRMMCWTVQAPSTSYTFQQGGRRLMQLTDWVDWSSVLSGQDNMYLQFGNVFTSFHYGDFDTEWVRYEDGSRREGWINGQEGTAYYQITHVHTFGDVWLPQDRTTLAIDKAAPTAWDDNRVKDPMCVKDGSDYRIFYAGNNNTTFKIGVATATDPDSAPTKDGGNPIVSPPSGYTDLFSPYVIKDIVEPDSNKLWKMLCHGFKTTGGETNILYFTAPSYNGTWTYSGSPVLSEGGASSVDEEGVNNPVIYWDSIGGQWVVFFAQKRLDPTTSQTIEDTSWATGSTLDNLTKSNTTLFTWNTNGQEVLTANLSGNIVTIADEAGFTVDSLIFISEDDVSQNYGISRIRKVTSGQLELYHELEGFTSGNSATIVQADRQHGQYLKHVEKVGNEYRFFGTLYRTYSHVSSYSGFSETSSIWTHSGPTVIGTTPVLEDLLYPNAATDYFGHERSHENIGVATLPLNRVIIPRNSIQVNQAVNRASTY